MYARLSPIRSVGLDSDARSQGLMRLARRKARRFMLPERMTGIGPVSLTWQARTLPLSYTRKTVTDPCRASVYKTEWGPSPNEHHQGTRAGIEPTIYHSFLFGCLHKGVPRGEAVHLGASRENRTLAGPIPRDYSTFELWRHWAVSPAVTPLWQVSPSVVLETQSKKPVVPRSKRSSSAASASGARENRTLISSLQG